MDPGGSLKSGLIRFQVFIGVALIQTEEGWKGLEWPDFILGLRVSPN